MSSSHEISVAVLVVQLVLAVVLFALYLLTTSPYLKGLSFYFPPASVMMLIGVILGAIFSASDEITDVFDFHSNIFFRVLLPPIIFYAGLHVPKHSFFRNLGSIAMLAFLGTVFSSFLIGSLIYAFRNSTLDDISVSFVSCMVLGSLLSAVDPVSTISVFQKSGVNVNLYTMIFGESILNDAVSIVVFKVFSKLDEDDQDPDFAGMIVAVLRIAGITLGSVILGIFLGLFTALILKHSRLHFHPPMEMGVIVLVSYLSFSLAEEIYLSGIMSCLFCAIIMDHYALFNVTKDTATSADSMFSMLADLAESFVFVYLGMAFFTFSGSDYRISFTITTFIWCIAIRALTIVVVSALSNIGRKRKITFRYQFVMFLSGLRGAVAFALAFEAPIHRNIFVTTTLLIIFGTTFLLGGSTYPTLRHLKLTKELEDEADKVDLTPEQETQHWLVKLDRDFLRPYFRISRVFPKPLMDASGPAPDSEQANRRSSLRKTSTDENVELQIIDTNDEEPDEEIQKTLDRQRTYVSAFTL